MQAAQLDAVGQCGHILRIEFLRRSDRYCQIISMIEPGGRNAPLLQSVEGPAIDDWPASPPLQNLSIEEVAPGRRAALLVGMAGRSHWSASIEPIAGQTEFLFDVACRTSESGASLGSLYRILATDSIGVAITPESGCAVQPGDADLLAVAPVGSASGTIRWKYRVSAARA